MVFVGAIFAVFVKRRQLSTKMLPKFVLLAYFKRDSAINPAITLVQKLLIYQKWSFTILHYVLKRVFACLQDQCGDL